METELQIYVEQHEEWLMARILSYAKETGYARYTSTLLEAWRLSISGLSASLSKAIEQNGFDFELGPDEQYQSDPASQFGIVEAQKHQQRGVNIEMFLGFMKYYRQSYADLIELSSFSTEYKAKYQHTIKRFFDRIEIAFCGNLIAAENASAMRKMEDKNRELTNVKNQYLTIFESFSSPVFIVALDGHIENMNYAAAKIVIPNAKPGSHYYSDSQQCDQTFVDLFPWLADDYRAFVDSERTKQSNDRYNEKTRQYFFVNFSKSLDVSGKFNSTIVTLEDISQRKLLEQELEILASTDPLTHALNRRAFLNKFDQEVARAQRYQYPMSILMVDIDYFKSINDTYGHAIGDTVIRTVVDIANQRLRESDLICRWGGEEFVLCLIETSESDAMTIAERIRQDVERQVLPVQDELNGRFTVSIGIRVVASSIPITAGHTIHQADVALYQAKQLGRNRCEVFSESMQSA